MWRRSHPVPDRPMFPQAGCLASRNRGEAVTTNRYHCHDGIPRTKACVLPDRRGRSVPIRGGIATRGPVGEIAVGMRPHASGEALAAIAFDPSRGRGRGGDGRVPGRRPIMVSMVSVGRAASGDEVRDRRHRILEAVSSRKTIRPGTFAKSDPLHVQAAAPYAGATAAIHASSFNSCRKRAGKPR